MTTASRHEERRGEEGREKGQTDGPGPLDSRGWARSRGTYSLNLAADPQTWERRGQKRLARCAQSGGERERES